MTDLNPQQEEAVQHVEGPLLVLAGAGSGKTRVVTHRIGRLIDLGVLPSEILAVTFTNRAADEMKTRIRTLKNVHVLASTFHSLGARILRESISLLGYGSDFTIYDEDDTEKLLKGCLEQMNAGGEKGVLRQIRLQISSAKNSLLGPDEIQEDPLFIQAYTLYQEKLKSCNALDFDDLLYLTVKLFKEHEEARRVFQNRWLFVLIDEYQDTNLAQYTLAKILVEKHQNIFAVGDPDQSIYSWRGARYQNILNFGSDFPGAKIITLDQNYRSTNTILKAANALIQHNENRYEKKLWSALGEGSKIGIYVGQSERQEADFVASQIFKHLSDGISPNDIAIFYRTNAQSRPFEDALLSRRLPYTIIGGLSFYERREIKDILAYLKMVLSNADLISFLRTINIPKRGLGSATLDKITLAAGEKSMPILQFVEELLEHPSLCPTLKLGPKQKEGVREYLRIVHSLRNRRGYLKIHELIDEVIQETHYLRFLQEDPESAEERKENLDELLGKAAEWEEDQEEPSLPKFLEELSLRSHIEENPSIPAIKMMTIHNSKGLEFNTAFVVGLEEDLFPHINCKDDPSLLEEERRLCYVGMTRAMRHLYLSSATYRYMWGTSRLMRPSRFLKEIPVQYLQNHSPFTLQAREAEEESFHTEGFSPGEEVRHKEFGCGVVKKSYQGSFGLTYEVHFPESGTTRTLAAKYAKLSPVS